MSRCCVVCGTPIAGRSHKILCSNSCTIRLHRMRKSLIKQFKAFLFGLPNSQNIYELESLLHSVAGRANLKLQQESANSEIQ